MCLTYSDLIHIVGRLDLTFQSYMGKLLLLFFMKTGCFLQLRARQLISPILFESHNKIIIELLKELLCFKILLRLLVHTWIQIDPIGHDDIDRLAYLFVISAR
jgi:hypothetical protein